MGSTERVDERGGLRRSWSRLGLVVVWAIAVAGIYLALTFAWPRTIPRLAVLPPPAAEPVEQGRCGEYTEIWEQNGSFWTPSVWSTGPGCINQA